MWGFKEAAMEKAATKALRPPPFAPTRLECAGRGSRRSAHGPPPSPGPHLLLACAVVNSGAAADGSYAGRRPSDRLQGSAKR